MSAIKGSNCDSGATKRKRKQNEATLVANMPGAIYRHFIPVVSTETVVSAHTESSADADVGGNTSIAVLYHTYIVFLYHVCLLTSEILRKRPMQNLPILVLHVT